MAYLGSMGRLKQFDRAEVLDRAMHLFWKQGYAATGMAELEGVMGINKFSIYAEFQHKRGLYLASLDHFVAAWQRPVFQRLGQDPGMVGILAFLDGLAQMTNMTGQRGCFLLAAGIEANHQDPEVMDRIEALYGDLELAFAANLSQEAPRLRGTPEQGAALLRTYVEGLLSRDRHGSMPENIKALNRMLVQGLLGPLGPLFDDA